MSLSVDKSLVENYAGYYDRDAGLHEWRELGAIDKCANILKLCSQFQHDDILEIGCGDGAILELLSRLGFASRFTGMEISQSAVRCVQNKAIPGLDIQLFDGYELSFPAKRFDLAVLSHVLEHVEYPRKLIREAAGVAKYVFVEVPLEDNWRLTNNFVFDRVGHINFYNVKTIRRLVQSCGMRILGAHLSHSSLESYVYRKGKLRGNLAYLTKETALKVSSSFATNVVTYHYSLVCTESSIETMERRVS